MVMVTAKIDKHAEGLMVDDAKFWVVQPRITLSGVSGLGTLLSGNYIGFEMGNRRSVSAASPAWRWRPSSPSTSRAESSC